MGSGSVFMPWQSSKWLVKVAIHIVQVFVHYWTVSSLDQGFLNFNVHTELQGGPVKVQMLLQRVQGGVCNSEFLAGSQVMLISDVTDP